MKHFNHLTDFSLEELQATLKQTKDLKLNRTDTPKSLDKQSWGLLFYKSSTRQEYLLKWEYKNSVQMP